MAAKIVELADALVDALRGHSFSQSFLCERRYYPVRDLADFAMLRVTVIPITWDGEPGSRSDVECDYTIELDIQQKLSGSEQLEGIEGDALQQLVEEIADYLLHEVPGVLSAKPGTLLDRDHWMQHGLFTAALLVTLKDFRTFEGA